MPDTSTFYLVNYRASDVFRLCWFSYNNTPTNLSLSVITAPSQIRLSWTENAPDQVGDGFKVYRAADGGDFALVATLPLATTQWDDTTAAWGHFYTYHVVEYCGNLESVPAEKRLLLPLQYDQLVLDDFGARDVGRTASQALGVEADGGRGLARVGTERLEVTDSWARLWFLACSTIETWALSDRAARLWSLARHGAETLVFSDGGGRRITRGVTEPLGLQDTTLRKIRRMITEIWALAENVPRGLGRFAEEALALSDGDVCDTVRAASELLTVADAGRRDFLRTRGEILSFADAMARQLIWARDTLENLGLVVNARREVKRPASEPIAFDVIGARDVTRPTSEALGFSDQVRRIWTISRMADALLELLDGDVREIALTGSEGLALSADGPRDISRNATETLSFDDALARYIARILAESLAFMAARRTGLVRRTQEALDLEALLEWLAQWVRPTREDLRLLDTAKIPGGTSGYPFDKEPFDARVVPALLKRRVRIEDI